MLKGTVVVYVLNFSVIKQLLLTTLTDVLLDCDFTPANSYFNTVTVCCKRSLSPLDIRFTAYRGVI